MGAVRLIQKPENGQLIINVPDEMRDQTLVVEFHPIWEEQSQEKTLAEISRAFFEKLPAPDPNLNWDELNVYKQ
ncbi:hypothetical protein WBJ53_02845 [Spirosoma sp. SC4-14]|uniref:hypothetical protein n=1 Tax=Spirosoma sp. SC4-14 TaxID=3128900 RepID=UPI0030D5D385